MVHICRGDGGYHDGLTVTPQTVLEEPGEGGVSVRDVAIQCLTLLRTFSETRNNLSQREKRFVDINSFLRRKASVSRLARSLTASQVDQLQLASDDIVNGRIVYNLES